MFHVTLSGSASLMNPDWQESYRKIKQGRGRGSADGGMSFTFK